MDADEHWGKRWPAEYSSILEGIPELYRPIWDRYDVHPIYFVSPDVLYKDGCCKVLKDEISKGAIIGAHLHGEYIEPDSLWGKDMETGNVPFPCYAYNTDVERQKLKNLTDLIEDRLGVKPEWYRAARFGADIDTTKLLKELGYKYDSSITPGIDWSSKGGPNHSKGQISAYRISDKDYYTGIGIEKNVNVAKDHIVEYPVTIDGKRFGILGRLLPNNWLFYKWLRPTHMTYLEMKHLIKKHRNNSNLVMMFHSMEIMVNKTPYVRWKWMQKYYLWRLTKICEYAKKEGYNL